MSGADLRARYQRPLSLAGIRSEGLGRDELAALARALLERGIHGVCFSAYSEGQGPGATLDEATIRPKLETVAPHVGWVRSFSCTEGNERIPGLAKALGLKTLVGVWLDQDREHNEAELANAIEVARAGHADVLAVGNEVLLRGELEESELIAYLERAQAAVPGIEVGYVDAYFQFVDHPAVTEACDVVLANCYPFWEGCPAEHALLYMKEMVRRAAGVAGGKRVIVTETGWPEAGSATGGAEPGYDAMLRYFIDTYRWAEEDDIEVFWFSAFDEAWKVDAEGDVGAYWGLWDRHGRLKFREQGG